MKNHHLRRISRGIVVGGGGGRRLGSGEVADYE